VDSRCDRRKLGDQVRSQQGTEIKKLRDMLISTKVDIWNVTRNEASVAYFRHHPSISLDCKGRVVFVLN